MNCAYSEMYLYDAMRNLGEMTEYAHDACCTDMDRALQYMIISGYAGRFQTGDPCVVSGMSGTELYQASAMRCGINMEPWPDALIRYETDAVYWVGYILAYYQWCVNRSFQNILCTVRASDLMKMYPALHTASEERAAESIEELYASRSQYTRLSEYRKRLGLTQAELASRSDINLRTLQQYEIGSKRLDKAAAATVFSLARVLNCAPEDLLDPRVTGF